MKKLFDIKFLKKHITAVAALVMIFVFGAVSASAWTETISSLKILTQKDGAVDSGINNTANINAEDTAINLDSYFNESGNVHLASCSSPDGENFYFPIKNHTVSGTSATKYRKGNINDKNVNYISFSLQIKSDSANRTFYFRQSPAIKINGTAVANTDTSVRMSLALNGNSSGIFANGNVNATPINSVSGATTNVAIKSFGSYSMNNSQKNALFTIDANQTANLTISLWLEDPQCAISSGVVSVDGLELVTEASKTTKFTFADQTSAYNDQNDKNVNTWHWVENDNAVMWMYDGTKSYKMTKNSDSDEWTANVNANAYTTSTTIIFYRTASTVTDPVADANDTTKVFNKWTTNYTTDKTTYTAYGASYDSSGNCRGTWSDAVQITLNAENTTAAKAVLPIPSTESPNKAAHIRLLYKENNSDISVQMCYENGLWRCYVPSTVTKLGFYSDTVEGTDTCTLKQTSTTLDRSTETAYTVTGTNTGYWGTGVLIKASVADGCKDYGTVAVTEGNNNVNGLKVTKGTSVKFTATANNGYLFKQWTAGSATNTSTSVTVTANSDLTYVAYFVEEYTITAHAATGGTVQLKTGGTAAATAKYTTTSGTSVTLDNVFTATANENYQFEGWYTAATDGTKITSAITLTSDRDVYARFSVKSRKVYLTNNQNWANVYCHAWNAASGSTNGAFPGVKMTYDSKNGYGQSIYVLEVPYTYDHIIFNNGSNSAKTVDITLPATGDVKYYISGGSGSNFQVTIWT